MTGSWRCQVDLVTNFLHLRYASVERACHCPCRSSLDLANEHKLSTIAFPALSCGVYGYPLPLAARTSLETCRKHIGNLREVHFVLFSADAVKAYQAAAAELFTTEKKGGSISSWNKLKQAVKNLGSSR